jgi:hypothetical protein
MYKNKNSYYLNFKTHHKVRLESKESIGIDSKNLKTNYQNKVVLTKRIVLKKNQQVFAQYFTLDCKLIRVLTRSCCVS